MIALYAEHWVNPGQMDNANKIFQTVTDTVTKAPGFLSRLILISQKDPMKVTTVTYWQSQEAFESWRKTVTGKYSREYLDKLYKVTGETFNVAKSV